MTMMMMTMINDDGDDNDDNDVYSHSLYLISPHFCIVRNGPIATDIYACTELHQLLFASLRC